MAPGHFPWRKCCAWGREISARTVEQQENRHRGTAGRAAPNPGEDTWGPQRCEFHVELKHESAEEEEGMAEDIRKVLEKFPGIQFEVLTFLGDRISETIAGETAPVVINVFGDDLDTIDAKAAEVAQVLQTVPGAKDVQLKSPPGAPRMAVRYSPGTHGAIWLPPGGYNGSHPDGISRHGGGAGASRKPGFRRSPSFWTKPSRRDPEGIGALMLSNAQGLLLPLSELAEVYLTDGRYSIMHEGARRRQVVTCVPEGRDVTSFVDDAKKQIMAKVNFPKGVYAIFTGAAGSDRQGAAAIAPPTQPSLAAGDSAVARSW